MSPNRLSVGDRFGRLTVKKLLPTAHYEKNKVLCLCKCGRLKAVQEYHLRSGATTSCRCFANELTSNRSGTHRLTKTKLYYAWGAIIQRCTNPANKQYPSYGGRGIAICDEWRTSFSAFADHVGKRPGSEYSIDRIDANGNYEPGNIRWATDAQQAINRTNNVIIEHDGRRLSVKEWSDLTGINYQTLHARLFDSMWTPKKAFSTPVRKR